MTQPLSSPLSPDDDALRDALNALEDAERAEEDAAHSPDGHPTQVLARVDVIEGDLPSGESPHAEDKPQRWLDHLRGVAFLARDFVKGLFRQ